MKREEIENMPAGREMDCLISKLVFGHTNVRVAPEHVWGALRDLTAKEIGDYGKYGVRHEYLSVSYYSINISDAWMVVEHLTNEGYCPGLLFDDNGHWALSFDGAQSVSFESETTDVSTAFFVEKELWCDTAPLAICRAALLALMDYDE